MTLGSVVGIIIGVIALLVVIMFPKECLTLFRGFTRIFINDLASTPEGAQAIYSEKIDKAQESYNNAKLAMEKAAGRLSNTQKSLQTLIKKKSTVESECESLVKSGKIDLAEIKAEEREEIIGDIERHEQMIAAYQDAVKTTTEIFLACEQNLRKLKKEAKEVVENMKTKKQLAEIYKETDELANSTATDKLLDQVREKNKELDEIAEGARVVHNARSSTRIQRAAIEAKKSYSNDFLDQLKKKYNTEAIPRK